MMTKQKHVKTIHIVDDRCQYWKVDSVFPKTIPTGLFKEAFAR